MGSVFEPRTVHSRKPGGMRYDLDKLGVTGPSPVPPIQPKPRSGGVLFSGEAPYLSFERHGVSRMSAIDAHENRETCRMQLLSCSGKKRHD
jgi:hypothetical protein